MNITHSAEKANLKNAKVLVVEDNEDQWALIQQAMRQCLHEVTVQRVASVPQAIALLDEWYCQEWELPKLILLDLYLPDNADGWQFLEQIKTMPDSLKRIPIIIFSSSQLATDISKSYQLGISSYLVKPVNYMDWLAYFQQLRTYWWETVTLPPVRYGI